MVSVASSASDGSGQKKKKTRGKYKETRKLMRWDPSVDQHVLLAVDAVCTEQGTPIPWDDIAKSISPFLSGEAIKQHLAKVRKAREEVGQPVPPKPKKGSRRKSDKGPNADDAPVAPAKAGRAKKIKEEGVDDADGDAAFKGNSLLWIPPKKQAKAPKTSAAGRGGRKNAKKAIAGEDDGEDINTILVNKIHEAEAKKTGKRGRPKKDAKKGDTPNESDDDSPTKKLKFDLNEISLRPTRAVDYKDHWDSDADEDDGGDILTAKQEGDDDEEWEEEEGEDSQNAVTQVSSTNYQGNTLVNAPAANYGGATLVNAPASGFQTPPNRGIHQDYPPSQTPIYRNGGNNHYNSPEVAHWDALVQQHPELGYGTAIDAMGQETPYQVHYRGPLWGNDPAATRVGLAGDMMRPPHGGGFGQYMPNADFGGGGFAGPNFGFGGSPPSPILASPFNPNPFGLRTQTLNELAAAGKDATGRDLNIQNVNKVEGPGNDESPKKTKPVTAIHVGENGLPGDSGFAGGNQATNNGAGPYRPGNFGPSDTTYNGDNKPAFGKFDFFNEGGASLHVDTNTNTNFAGEMDITTAQNDFPSFDELMGATSSGDMNPEYDTFGVTNTAANEPHSANSFDSSQTILGSATDEAMQVTDPGNQTFSHVDNVGDFKPAGFDMGLPEDGFGHADLFGLDGEDVFDY